MQADWSHYAEVTQLFPDAAISYATLLPRARGFDTSYWNHGPAGAQKPIDFQVAYLAGYTFWIGRLTRGQNYIDTWIEEDYQAASQTPLIKAVYHVLYPGEPVGPHIENLEDGLALLPELPKAIGLDLERGAQFGAAAVTKCLVDTVAAIREWWDIKLLLYGNLNYLRNYILDTCGLDIWLSWPAADNGYNPIDNPPIDCAIYQRSYRQAIPGTPDTTIDLDEFMGDELQMFAYFTADEPEPEEPPMPDLDTLKAILSDLQNVSEALDGDMRALNDYIVQAEGEPLPEPPTPPAPPPPAPANVRNFKVKPAEGKPRANARFIKGTNDAGYFIFEIYPSDSSTAAERQQFDIGMTVQVEGDLQRGDSGTYCYQLYDPEGRYKAHPLFIRQVDGYLV